MIRIFSLAVLAFLALEGCSEQSAPQPDAQNANQESPAGFVNKVWTVRQSSSVAAGSIYVFLEDGTLVMTAPGGAPAFGAWTFENGVLTMVEESRPYRIDILNLTRDVFRIRSNNPGQPVEITLVPAALPPVPK